MGRGRGWSDAPLTGVDTLHVFITEARVGGRVGNPRRLIVNVAPGPRGAQMSILRNVYERFGTPFEGTPTDTPRCPSQRAPTPAVRRPLWRPPPLAACRRQSASVPHTHAPRPSPQFTTRPTFRQIHPSKTARASATRRASARASATRYTSSPYKSRKLRKSTLTLTLTLTLRTKAGSHIPSVCR